MSVFRDNVSHLEISFKTLQLPAPFSHTYHLLLDLTQPDPVVDFNIHYTERETLSDEEIMDEGFTPQDDYQWQGSLDKVWKPEVVDQLLSTNKLTNTPKLHAQQVLKLKASYNNDKQIKGIPDNATSWEYFVQEVIQAIYELSGKELPLEVIYHEVTPDYQHTVSICPSFSHRNMLTTHQQGDEQYKKEHNWDLFKPLMEAIYLPDYDTEQASESIPNQPGKYIMPGDGYWYQLGVAVRNPGKKRDVLQEMEDRIGQLS